jgi:molecular chaperone Hsp33
MALKGDTLKQQLKDKARDRVHTFLMADDTVKCAFINGTRMVKEMRANFRYGILETLVAGHAYLACGLLSTTLKGQDRLNLRIDCSGPIKGFSIEANARGEVRGYLKQVPIPISKPLTDFNLSPFFGAGFLTITKFLEGMKQPYTGQVALQYGSIAQDLAYYFFTSEQTPTVFILSIQFDKDGEVKGAGGLFIQTMPGASTATFNELESIVNDFPSPGKLMADLENPELIIHSQFSRFTPKYLTHERIEFFCPCNEEKIAGYIAMLPMDELRDMYEKGPFPIETRCHNCNTVYLFQGQTIRELYEKRLN